MNVNAVTTPTRLAGTRYYPAQRSIVGAARRQVAAMLCEWRLPVSMDDAELTVSELVTNAVRLSGPSDQVAVHLRWIGIGLVIGVWDSSPAMPIASTVGGLTLDDITPDPKALEDDDNRAGGWGLPLVEAVASAFQVERTSSPAGKWVITLLRHSHSDTKGE
ncbi:ATP-binding protein [Actinomadura roseirufa]|uniref:ATP-binding protein n=1 Tax=Actinomadura roseirufa TaxID=2094049 RepID=UPI00104143EB|nr:ATP-binding protein [Actinomadura roseirufa]